MGLTGNGLQTLEGETYTQLIGTGKAGQKTVVIATATTEAMSLAVESHAGDEGQVDFAVTRGGKDLTHGFHDVKRSLPKTVGAAVKTQLQVVAHDYGQQDGLTRDKSLVEKELQIGFVGQGMVEQDCTRRLPSGRSGH